MRIIGRSFLKIGIKEKLNRKGKTLVKPEGIGKESQSVGWKNIQNGFEKDTTN